MFIFGFHRCIPLDHRLFSLEYYLQPAACRFTSRSSFPKLRYIDQASPCDGSIVGGNLVIT